MVILSKALVVAEFLQVRTDRSREAGIASADDGDLGLTGHRAIGALGCRAPGLPLIRHRLKIGVKDAVVHRSCSQELTLPLTRYGASLS
jgi:hypothetical protein